MGFLQPLRSSRLNLARKTGCMAKKSGGSGRVERDAGSGRYVPNGTEKRRPGQTVTEPRKPRKK